LIESLDIPIGLIRASYSGTYTQGWISKEIYESDPDFIDNVHLESNKKYEEDPEKYKELYENYKRELRYAIDNATQMPMPIANEYNFIQFSNGGDKQPSFLYNAMIYPLFRLSFAGIIWYQGEGNSVYCEQHRKLFPELIKSWRRGFGDDTLPFIFIQLPRFNPTGGDWARFRETQEDALVLPNTGMTCTIDTGYYDDIHPHDKKEVGLRTSLLARKLAYKEDIWFYGPKYKSHEILDDKIKIDFDYTHGGLVLKGKLGFEICGDDGIYVAAKAEIDNDSVLVFEERIKSPKAVRYAFENFPEICLFNKKGLPAFPFRTNRNL
jgi:sialate O-acetylesterase